MGLERDGDLDVGVLTSSRKVLSRDPTRCAACARHARTLPNGLKCLPRSYPSSANRGRRSATRIDKNGSEWISSTSIQPSQRASVEERKTTWCVEGHTLTRCDVMSPSPGLATRSVGRHSPGSTSINPTTAWPPDNGSGRASHHLAETGNSLWPARERILSEYKRASCLKPASDCLRTPHCAKKHASLPLLRCWPKSCTGSPRQKVARQQQDGSCAWSSICQSTMRLPHPRSTVCTPLGEAEDALAFHRSCRWKPVFRRWPAYLHLRAAILRRRAMCVGFGDRQPCLGRSRHWSDGVARYPRGRERLVRDRYKH